MDCEIAKNEKNERAKAAKSEDEKAGAVASDGRERGADEEPKSPGSWRTVPVPRQGKRVSL